MIKSTIYRQTLQVIAPQGNLRSAPQLRRKNQFEDQYHQVQGLEVNPLCQTLTRMFQRVIEERLMTDNIVELHLYLFFSQKPMCTCYNGFQISSKMMFKCFAFQSQASRTIGFLEFFFSLVLISTEVCMFSSPACEEKNFLLRCFTSFLEEVKDGR